ncbi:MAG: nucleotidyl transferase AbiEii/AbiGii toxin family protein [Rhodobacteraceae bacterium]|nr:nucleotidyl transferase AbiEii/AbiGii toxin family protein [Paracoccaceae bacterium]
MIHRYETPQPARQILDRAAPVLLAGLTRKEILIGGGTALAARWGHRSSSDIYITVLPAAFSRSIDRLIQMLGQTGIAQFESGQGWMKGVYEEGEFGISTTEPLLPVRVEPRERESIWNIALESIEEILARKILLRMNQNGEFVVRDFYDVVTAGDLAPQTLEAALTVLENHQRKEIADEITHFGARLGNRITNLGRPLLDVHRPEWLPTLANRAALLIADGHGLSRNQSPKAESFTGILSDATV